jgi:hypothetical protein
MKDMIYNEITNILCEEVVRSFGGRMLDSNNICWRIIDGKWIGKRSVWTLDYRAIWLEETTPQNVKSWWCGEDADYNETFYRDKKDNH